MFAKRAILCLNSYYPLIVTRGTTVAAPRVFRRRKTSGILSSRRREASVESSGAARGGIGTETTHDGNSDETNPVVSPDRIWARCQETRDT